MNLNQEDIFYGLYVFQQLSLFKLYYSLVIA